MERAIEAHLAQHPDRTFRARELRAVVGASRTADVNRLLYETLAAAGRVQQCAENGVTTWRAPPARPLTDAAVPPPVPSADRTWIAVDLGNVHDCFLPARAQTAGDPAVAVFAYADYAYNGPELAAADDGSVWQAPASGRNLADMALLFAVQRALLGPAPPATVVIASKDKLMQDALTVLRDLYPETEFVIVREWDELKMFL